MIALNLYEQQKSSEAGKIINRSRFTVRGAIKWFLGKKDVTNATQSCRPRKLTDQEKERKSIKKEPTFVSSKVVGIVKSDYNAEISQNKHSKI
jgi:transposase